MTLRQSFIVLLWVCVSLGGVGGWLYSIKLLGDRDKAAAVKLEAVAAPTPAPALDPMRDRVWGNDAVIHYTDPHSGQRYIIVSTGYHGGVAIIKAEPDKLPEAK
jgi:hypothetical protein